MGFWRIDTEVKVAVDNKHMTSACFQDPRRWWLRGEDGKGALTALFCEADLQILPICIDGLDLTGFDHGSGVVRLSSNTARQSF